MMVEEKEGNYFFRVINMFCVQVIKKLYSHAAKLVHCQYISFGQLDFSVVVWLIVNNNNIVNSLSGGLHKQQTKRKKKSINTVFYAELCCCRFCLDHLATRLCSGPKYI